MLKGVSAPGPQGSPGATGAQGPTGNTGPAGPSALGVPNARTLALATAYQATNPAKPAQITVNLTSGAGLSITSGTSNTAQVVIGPTTAVASGTGTVIGNYANSLSGTLVVGLLVNTTASTPMTFSLPANWYFAVIQTAGNVTITSAFDQAVG